MQTVVLTETSCTGGSDVELMLPEPRAERGFYRDIAVIAFPRPAGSARIKDLDYKILSGRIRNHLEPDTAAVPDAAVVKAGDVIDITNLMEPSGRLTWTAPEGDWVVLRIGHTTTGTENHPAVAGGPWSRMRQDEQGGCRPLLAAWRAADCRQTRRICRYNYCRLCDR